ncbi:hypothetical protein JOQ06_014989, partial [Pogonophryne albipinna]
GRGVNSGYNAAQACLTLPGENIRRGIDAAEEKHAALFIGPRRDPSACITLGLGFTTSHQRSEGCCFRATSPSFISHPEEKSLSRRDALTQPQHQPITELSGAP